MEKEERVIDVEKKETWCDRKRSERMEAIKPVPESHTGRSGDVVIR